MHKASKRYSAQICPVSTVHTRLQRQKADQQYQAFYKSLKYARSYCILLEHFMKYHTSLAYSGVRDINSTVKIGSDLLILVSILIFTSTSFPQKFFTVGLRPEIFFFFFLTLDANQTDN